ncbi:MAG: SulP family inorganic anion transporter [Nitrococcus mobilis]|nr:SulP family inorganic anion transporter [Nitrococcus mobilis]
MSEQGKEGGTFVRDLMASIVVFCVALPLCMGIAIASGVPPALGLVTGIVGGIVVGALAGQPLQVGGPAAGLTVLVWDIVQRHGLEMLGVVVLAAGLIQVVAALIRLAPWFRAVSPAVIQGMLSGIGVLIFASQFHVMMDAEPQGSGIVNLISIPEAVYKGIFPMETATLAAMIGLATLLTLMGWNAFRPKGLRAIPGPLVGVIVASVAAAIVGLDIRYVEVPRNLVDSVNIPAFSDFARLAEPVVFVDAVTIALVASAETLLCSAAVDRMQNRVRTNYNRELLAQGVGNTLAGSLGALPLTGVIVRSTVNIEAGARTRLSPILHGVWLLGLVVAFPQVLELIPRAALAAILVYTGYRLFNMSGLRRMWRLDRMEFGICIVTLSVIVLTDLLTGIITGVVLSFIKLVRTLSHLEIEVTQTGEKRYEVDLHGAATFVRLPELAETIERLPGDSEIHLHVGGLVHVDRACLEWVQNHEGSHASRGGQLIVDWNEFERRNARKPFWNTGQMGQEILSLAGRGRGRENIR